MAGLGQLASFLFQSKIVVFRALDTGFLRYFGQYHIVKIFSIGLAKFPSKKSNFCFFLQKVILRHRIMVGFTPNPI